MNSGSSGSARIVLDTSAFSRFQAGHKAVFEAISSAELVFLPGIVVGELEAGFRLGRRVKANQIILADFLAEPFVSILPVSVSVAKVYGRVFAELKRSGTPIPANDIWIAAVTLDVDGHLITFDRHFEKVRALKCSLFRD